MLGRDTTHPRSPGRKGPSHSQLTWPHALLPQCESGWGPNSKGNCISCQLVTKNCTGCGDDLHQCWGVRVICFFFPPCVFGSVDHTHTHVHQSFTTLYRYHRTKIFFFSPHSMQCDQGYGLNNRTLKCEKCPANCQSCDGANPLTTCVSVGSSSPAPFFSFSNIRLCCLVVRLRVRRWIPWNVRTLPAWV